MIELTEEMSQAIDNALGDGTPCIIGTASGAGMPNISYRGSVMVFDRTHLAFWERAKNISDQNLRENPQIEVFYRNREKGLAWRFYGRATILETGDIRDQIMSRTVERELASDPERKGFGVLIEVDKVSNGRGEPLQER
jgi:predicted pyridoxine 5'-phosphate oxidase superfamily flavin-nucleotide-binding protein